MITINRPKVSGPVSTDVERVFAFVQELSEGYSPRDFALRFWDGTMVDPEPGNETRFTLVFNHSGAARRAFWPFDPLAFGEAYIYGDIDIEGDVKRFLHLARHWENRQVPISKKLNWLYQLLRMPKGTLPRPPGRRAKTNSQQRSETSDQDAIQFHYDGPPSSFYREMLGKQMQYSCGYFANPDDDIETAQERKLDYICRKLQLSPNERLIDLAAGGGA